MAEALVDGTRTCRKCGVEQRLNRDHFKNTNGKDHTWRHVCRECERQAERDRHGWKPRVTLSAEERKERERIRSRAWYVRNAAHQSEKIRAARQSDPEFHRRRDQLYYEQHRDAKRARAKAYRKANPDKVRRWMREWEDANRDRKNELGRESYARRREKEIARVVEWARKNRDKQAASRARRRAKVLAAGGRLTDAHIAAQRERQNGLCYYCGASPSRWEVDHFIPLDRGGSGGPENIVMACMPCNRSKGNKLPWERWPERFDADCKP